MKKKPTITQYNKKMNPVNNKCQVSIPQGRLVWTERASEGEGELLTSLYKRDVPPRIPECPGTESSVQFILERQELLRAIQFTLLTISLD